MPEKDPLTYSLITYLWVLSLASWGGIVSFNNNRKNGVTRPFNFVELIGEISTSAFVGVLTFWLCESAGINSLVSAALVGISGHAGSRVLRQLEKWAERKMASFGGINLDEH